MKVKHIKVGKIPMIEVENALGLKVTLCNVGASIYSIYLNEDIMTLTPKNPNDFLLPTAYYGKTIGAITNRVKGGKVLINDKEYQMQLNEGDNTLHGGNFSLSNLIFSQKLNYGNNFFSVIFSFKKKKLKDGLPGNINYYICYSINDSSNDILLDMKAVSDDDTVIALTNHSYFCLGDKNVNNLSLQINASKYVVTDKDDLTPLEEKEVSHVLDFKKMKLISKDLNNKEIQSVKTKGYDHHYIFDDDNSPIILENRKYRLTIETNFSGCQIYTDNYPDNIIMTANENETFNRGVAIEPQDSPLDRKVIKKGQLYNRIIKYSFIQK